MKITIEVDINIAYLYEVLFSVYGRSEDINDAFVSLIVNKKCSSSVYGAIIEKSAFVKIETEIKGKTPHNVDRSFDKFDRMPTGFEFNTQDKCSIQQYMLRQLAILKDQEERDKLKKAMGILNMWGGREQTIYDRFSNNIIDKNDEDNATEE